ncbi:uncharacterized protein BT62DRAFT_226825 [Guyanagaster necrorhizus]|uniref:Uncharacterized protein n=1 Tax=Guyanagaster necrorhizus TaxID=856835 RepID=A0A9P7VP33_9AGAR|nr:uncharacterized protein BT62DRAFT_226825 [Guyanagaster necrorhizus MCA 3950]KAG7444781.1 hypothetical protein BT62DRAFT_226825 [Guyanagaster necrorhizus MCA 3950]
MKFSAFVSLAFLAFGTANAGIIIRPRTEADSGRGFDNGLKAYQARQEDIDSVAPYDNGPSTYWVRGVEESSPYDNGPDTYWVRDIKAREEGVDSAVPYASGPESYWVRDVKARQPEIAS